MAEELNLGRLVAEIALENSELKENAEEAINVIQNIAETAENIEPAVNITVNTDSVDEALESIAKSVKETNPGVTVEVNTDSMKENVENIEETVQALAVQINNLSSEIDKNQETLRNAAYSEEEYKKGTNQTINTVDKLKVNISEQEKELKKLKEQYSNSVLENGRYSSSTKDIAAQIDKLSSEIDENRKKLNDAAYSTENYQKKLSETADTTEKESRAIEQLQKGLTVLKDSVSNLVSDGIDFAVDKFKELMISGDKALNRLQVQTGMTNEEVSSFKDNMYDLYKNNYGESLEDIAETMFSVRQTFNETDPDKIEKIAQKAYIMKDAFGSDIEETLQGVNALISDMGLSADDAFDYIAKGIQNGLNKTGELNDNLAEYTQIWEQAGFSAEEMFSVFQNGIDSGAYSLDKVNDFIKEFSISLSDGRIEDNLESFSDKTSKLFNSWKQGDATQADIFQSVIDDLANMTNQQEALSLASDTWSSLSEDNAIKVINALNQVDNTYKNVQGTMESIESIAYDDIESELNALGRRIEVDIIQPVVEGATPAIEGVINFVADNLPIISSLILGVASTFATYKLTTKAIEFVSGLKSVFTALTAALFAQTTATEGATVAQAALNAVMNANPIGVVIGLIGGLVAAFTTFSLAANNAADSTKDYIKAIEEVETNSKNIEAQAQTEVATINALAEQYDKLRNKTNLTAYEKQKLESVSQQLSDKLGISTEELKDQNGAYKDLSKNIQQVTDDLIKQAKIQAIQNVLTKAYEEEAKAKADYFEKLDELVEKGIRDPDAKANLDNYHGENQKFEDETKELSNALDNCTKKVAQYEKQLEEVLQDEEDVTEITEDLSKSNNDYSKSIQEQIKNIDTLSKKREYLQNLLKEAQDNYKEENIVELQKQLTEVDSIINSLNNTVDENITKNSNLALSWLKIVKSEEEIEKETKNFVNMFSTVVSVENDLQNTVDEVAESNELSLNTLNSLVKKYPELIDVVNGYISGIKTEQDIINELTEIYENDVDNYNQAVTDKISLNTDVYNEIISKNSDMVNELRNQYGIDLNNFKSAEEAKIAITKEKFKEQQTINGYTLGMVNGQMYYMPDELLTEEQRKQVEAARASYNHLDEVEKNLDSFIEDYYKNYLGEDDYKYLKKNIKSTNNSNNKTPLKQELEQLQHKKNIEELTSKQEYDWLVRISNKYSMSADERMDMDEKIHTAKRQYEQELAEQQEKNIQAEYDNIEKLTEQGKITTRQEIAQLEKIYQKYKLTTEQKITLEEKLAKKKEQLKNEEISALDTLGDAVVSALKNKYQQQKELEEKRIDESIESWQKWEDETCQSIQGQIDALNELKNAHDEENQRQEYENKRQALELQLAYEKDDYNRKQIQKEIAALDKNENERLFNLQIEEQKKALQEQIDSVKSISSEKQEILNKKKDTLSEKYGSLTSDFTLQAEAHKTIINSSQRQLIDLINSYAPEYEMAGASLGEALYNGMNKKTSDISSYVSAIEKAVDSATAKEKTKAVSNLESYTVSQNGRAVEVTNISAAKSSEVKSVQSSIDKLAATIDSLLNGISLNATSYKNQMAITANDAADRYYSTQKYYTSSQNKISNPTNVYMTVNFNDKVDSPIEVKRQLESVSEQLARQIAGGY